MKVMAAGAVTMYRLEVPRTNRADFGTLCPEVTTSLYGGKHEITKNVLLRYFIGSIVHDQRLCRRYPT